MWLGYDKGIVLLNVLQVQLLCKIHTRNGIIYMFVALESIKTLYGE